MSSVERGFPLNAPDPRSPLVFDTRELGRRAGAMRKVRREVPAPADLHVALTGVAEGSPMALDLRFESVVEGVLVSGTASALITGECARCLDDLQDTLDVDLQELFTYPGHESETTAEEETFEVVDEYIDLEPVVRDAVVLALQFSPVCRDDCLGLCVECGARLNDQPDHTHESLDPRWAGLTGLAQPTADSTEAADLEPSDRSSVSRVEEK